MRPSSNIALAALVAALFLAGCEDGDWLGPVERGIRAGVNGWDMWATDAVRPYEQPQPPVVPGTVPQDRWYSFAAGAEEIEAIPVAERRERAATAYRRFCHHCHGPNGDGRIIVGESLEIKPTDLRGDKVQRLKDRQIFEHVRGGGELMLPLAQTMSPRDILLTVGHLRTLRAAESKPHFEPQYTKPIE
ncbi:MAG: cytochrome c [Deltaproteobacteria bacterium]|nr:cytochrome c [Deltaproteobacteria bacterium]